MALQLFKNLWFNMLHRYLRIGQLSLFSGSCDILENVLSHIISAACFLMFEVTWLTHPPSHSTCFQFPSLSQHLFVTLHLFLLLFVKLSVCCIALLCTCTVLSVLYFCWLSASHYSVLISLNSSWKKARKEETKVLSGYPCTRVKVFKSKPF